MEPSSIEPIGFGSSITKFYAPRGETFLSNRMLWLSE